MRGHERQKLLILAALLVLGSCCVATSAWAANLQDPNGSFTGLLDLVKNSAAQWNGKLRGYATTVFWLLASIQFVWTFMPLVFRQADFGEIVGELVRFILVIGFFFALLSFSADWADKVVRSFRMAGGTAAGIGAGAELQPGDMFEIAIDLAHTIGNVETWNPATAVMISLAGLVVLLCFAFIAAFMALTIIESYVVINASVLFMGFGGSQWTRDYALAIVRYAVSAGAKLFILTLIVGLVVNSAKTWQAAYQADAASMWTMVGLSLTCAYLAKTIPELVAGMISGASMGGGATIGGMAAAAAAGAALATGGAAALAGAAGAASGSGAAGAAGAAGAPGTGGIGGGGLAAAINSSFASGGAPAAASTGTSAMSGLGASTGGQAAAKGASSAGARVGGSAAQDAAGSAPKQPSGSIAQAAKQAEKGKQASEDESAQERGATMRPQDAPTGSQGEASKRGSNLFDTASAGVRGAGILSSISVPGMEGAAGLSLGAGAPQAAPAEPDEPSMAPAAPPVGAEPTNVIRPVDAGPTRPSTPSPSKPETKEGDQS